MANDVNTDERIDPLKILDDEILQVEKSVKEYQAKLNNHTLESIPKDNLLLEIQSIIQEQNQFNQNMIRNIESLAQKIYIIRETVIGNPNNLSQVGTILDRLEHLERNSPQDPTEWPNLPILNSSPITTQEENIAHTLLSLLYTMVDYAKVNSNYKQMKFPLNSNLGESHLRFERRYYNIQFFCRNAIGIVESEFLQSVLFIAKNLHFGLILTDCLDFGIEKNIKIIKHRKSFDELGNIYSSMINIIFEKCPFGTKPGIKDFFLTLPFPGYYKNGENE